MRKSAGGASDAGGPVAARGKSGGKAGQGPHGRKARAPDRETPATGPAPRGATHGPDGAESHEPAEPRLASAPELAGVADAPDDHRHVSAPGAVPSGLHLVATPIGNARDITLHTLDLLAGADVLAAEDTRSLRRLLEIHGVALRGRSLLAYHDHSAPAVRGRIMRALAEGRTVVYAPEAGTPMVSDPGFRLAQDAIAAGIAIHAAPGPSAALAALVVAGLPTDRFCFLGFLPATASARRRFLSDVATVPATLVFFEAARRLPAALRDMAEMLGPDRDGAVCRELTKRHEEVRRGSLSQLADAAPQAETRGEVVLVVERCRAEPAAGPVELDAALRAALARTSLREAVAEVATVTGLPRRQVYQAALDIEKTGTAMQGGAGVTPLGRR